MRCPFCHDNIIVQGRFCPKCGEQVFGRPVLSRPPAAAEPVPDFSPPYPPSAGAQEDVLEIELEGPEEPSGARAESVGKLCPYCRFPIKSGDEVVTCPDCQTVHHGDCWRANEGCTTYGCASSPQAAAVRRTNRTYAEGTPSAGASRSALRPGAGPIGAQQLIEAEFDGQCTNALLFTILQLFFCAGILSIIAFAWGMSLLSQMKRLGLGAAPVRTKAIITVIISGGVMLLWLLYFFLALSRSGG